MVTFAKITNSLALSGVTRKVTFVSAKLPIYRYLVNVWRLVINSIKGNGNYNIIVRVIAYNIYTRITRNNTHVVGRYRDFFKLPLLFSRK